MPKRTFSQCDSPTLSDIMSQAKEDGMCTDIQFVIGKDPFRKTFDAHKAILACGSPVFNSMFYGNLAEKKNPVVVEDDDPEAFDMLLNYIYGKGDKIQLNSYLSAWKYYSIGDKYLVEGIKKGVERFIKYSSMEEKDFWWLIENDLLVEPIFSEKFDKYVSERTNKILNFKKALQIPDSLVEYILQKDKLKVSEYELLQFTAKWGNSNIPSKERSKEMKKFFQHIRFSVLSLEDFCSFTESYPDLIDAQSCIQIFKHLCNRTLYKLPNWCSINNCYRSRNSNFRDGLYCRAYSISDISDDDMSN